MFIIIALLVYVGYKLSEKFYVDKGNQLLIYQNNDKLGIKWNEVCASALLVLIMGMRGLSFGADIANYKSNYDLLIRDAKAGHSFEPMFQLLTLINARIFKNDFGFTVCLFEYALIMVCAMNCVSSKLSKNKALTMFLFASLGFYFRGFEQIRQMLALSLFLVGVSYEKDDKRKTFLFWLFAVGFHKTAIMLLPIYLICKITIKDWRYIVLFAGSIILFLLKEPILRIACKILNYEYYNAFVDNTFVNEITAFGYLRLFLLVFAFLFCLIAKIIYKTQLDNKKYNTMLNIFSFSVVFCLLGILTKMPLVFGRLTFYFVWPLFLMLPEIQKSVKHKKIFELLVIVIGICYTFGSTILRNTYGVSDYKFIFME